MDPVCASLNPNNVFFIYGFDCMCLHLLKLQWDRGKLNVSTPWDKQSTPGNCFPFSFDLFSLHLKLLSFSYPYALYLKADWSISYVGLYYFLSLVFNSCGSHERRNWNLVVFFVLINELSSQYNGPAYIIRNVLFSKYINVQIACVSNQEYKISTIFYLKMSKIGKEKPKSPKNIDT